MFLGLKPLVTDGISGRSLEGDLRVDDRLLSRGRKLEAARVVGFALVGGIENGKWTGAFYSFDVLTKIWEQVPSLPFVRRRLSAVVYSKKISILISKYSKNIIKINIYARKAKRKHLRVHCKLVFVV